MPSTAPSAHPLGFLATLAGMQDLQSPTTFQAELSGFPLGQEAHPISNSLQLPSQTAAGQQKTWNGGLTEGFCSLHAPGLPHAGGGYLLLRRPQPPSSSDGNRGCERREEWGVANPAFPWPLAWEVGEGERGKEQQQLESQGAPVLSGGAEPAARSCSSDTQCPAKSQAFNSIKCRTDFPDFSVCECM